MGGGPTPRDGGAGGPLGRTRTGQRLLHLETGYFQQGSVAPSVFPGRKPALRPPFLLPFPSKPVLSKTF